MSSLGLEEILLSIVQYLVQDKLRAETDAKSCCILIERAIIVLKITKMASKTGRSWVELQVGQWVCK